MIITLILQSAYEKSDGTAPGFLAMLGIVNWTRIVPFALFKLNEATDRKAIREIKDQLRCCRFHIGSGQELDLAAKERPDVFPATTALALGKRYEPILYCYNILSGSTEVAPDILQEGALFFATRS